MDLNSGYKQTEVGVIPEDWKQTKIRAIACTARNAIVGGPFGSDLVSLDYVDDGIPVIRGQNMSSRWVSGNFVFVSPAKAKSLEANLARPGDLVFTQRGSLGQVSLVPKAPFDRYLVSQSQMKLSVNRAIADPLFFYFVFTSEDQQKLIRQGTIQTGVPHINLGILRDLPIQLPPLGEQEAIAEALSDADVLIKSIEQLIAKKRHTKQGAMQELMQPTDGWIDTTLGCVTDRIVGGGTPSRRIPSYWGGAVPWMTVKDFASHSPLGTKEYITREGLKNSASNLIPRGTLITSARMALGKAVVFDVDVSINQDLKAIFPRKDIDTRFLFYWFQFNEPRIAQMGSGSTVMGISLDDLKKISFSKPPRSEQVAIAAILTGMDSELAGLESKLVKYRQLKQGMMHNLLTGKIRLVAPSLAEVKPRPATREKSTARATESGSHTWAFNEAVIISVLSDQFGNPEFPLGRKRRTKLSYLFHRRTDQDVQGYLKKAAGPYNPRAKYAGPEKIAQENGYVRNHQSGKFSGFIAAEKIAQAKTYFAKWYDPKITAWLEQFRFKSNDELECLATVDMAMQELLKEHKTADVDSVRNLIASEPDWLPKLNRSAFSDLGIAEAIAECHALFG